MEMSMSMQAQANAAKRNQEAHFRQKAQRVGTETISVPAGTFVCEHYRMTDGSGDIWFSPKVSPWGLVKFQRQRYHARLAEDDHRCEGSHHRHAYEI